MFNQYIKIGIEEDYINSIYSEIIDYIGKKFKDEIKGNNNYGNKGRRIIYHLIKQNNPKCNISKAKIKAFCQSYKTLISREHLRIPRHESMLILNTIVKLIEDDKKLTNKLKKYCVANNINEVNRIYRTILIPVHYNELKNNVLGGELKNDRDAENVYSDLNLFTKKIKS